MPRSMTIAARAASAAFALSLAVPAMAAEVDSARFQIEKTKYGFVRLDRETGAMTFCREDDETLTCDPAATAKPAVEDTIADLKGKVDAFAARMNAAEAANKDLAARLKAAEDSLKASQAALASRSAAPASGDDQQLDDGLKRMEKMLHWFMGVSRELEEGKGLPQQP